MKKTPIFAVLLSLSALASVGPVVSASHEASMFVVSGFTANTEHWVDILSNCDGTIGYPENTLFFVSSGWAFAPWMEALEGERRAFMSEATTFAFLVDGQVQMQSRVYQYFLGPDPLFGVPDLMAKLFNTEYDNGLTGSHVFTGQFYLDASLIGAGEFGEPFLFLQCDTTVNFTA